MSNSNIPAKSEPNKLNPVNAAGNIFNARNTALKPMRYSSRVTRNNPCAIVILLDQSGSMGRKFINNYGEERTKSQAVAEVVNELFESLLMKCQKDSLIREYFDFLVIGYGNLANDSNISIAWEGGLEGKEWVSVAELKDNILRKESFTKKETLPWGAIKEENKTRKIWIEPRHEGESTPMFGAFKLCKKYIDEWVQTKTESFPPMVFNITDGKPTDVASLDEFVKICEELKSISTNDGNVLLFNCLLTDDTKNELFLPSVRESEAVGENKYQTKLIESSSYLPIEMSRVAHQMLNDEKFLHEQIKGVILNSSIKSLVKLLNIGTNTALSTTND